MFAFSKLILSLTMMLCLVGCRPQSNPKRIDDSEVKHELVRQIRAKLRDGWTVTSEEKYSQIEISREESFMGKHVFPSMSGEEPLSEMQFSFAFRITQKVTDDQYGKMAQENIEIGAQLEKLRVSLKKLGVIRKGDSFIPSGAEQEALVGRYNLLKEELHDLPDYYFDELSLSWIYGSENSSFTAEDEAISKECREVREEVLSLLSEYK